MQVTLLMVVGAGRGPLVRAAINASHEANRTLRIVAVEKNANAVITLRNLAAMERWDNVTIVATDMRQWSAPEKVSVHLISSHQHHDCMISVEIHAFNNFIQLYRHASFPE